jgi:DNA-binding NarL/FixJ family response regulator
MNQANRANVDFVFADADGQFRLGLRNALVHEGYKNIRDCSTVAKIYDVFESGAPDLLLIDAHMGEGAAFDVIEKIRRSELGSNPSLMIMVTLAAPDPDLVKRVIQSGVDDLLLKPISTTQMMQRIQQHAEQRQRFVVTADYIGPQRRKDRKKDDSEEGLKLEAIEVPNTLGAKARGEEVDEFELQKLIAKAQTEINEQRLKRNAPEISALVREIVPAYEKGEVDAEVEAKVLSLSKFADDVSERLAGTQYVHVSDLCAILGSISGSLKGGQSNPKSIALLKPLSDAIGVSFNPKEGEGELASQVITLVRNYIEAHAAEFARLE